LLLRVDPAAEQVADPFCQVLVICHALILYRAADMWLARSAHRLESGAGQSLSHPPQDGDEPHRDSTMHDRFTAQHSPRG
ncbi:MAG: hypothetical protein WBB15_11775, partial [Ornithinimicrobium sp.]